MEPFTSILIRELKILERDFGSACRACNEIGRALRRLRSAEGYDKMAINKGGSGQEISPDPSGRLSQPSLDFGSGSEEDYD